MLKIPEGSFFEYLGKNYLASSMKFEFVCAECGGILRHTFAPDDSSDLFICSEEEAHDGVILRALRNAMLDEECQLFLEFKQVKSDELMAIADKYFPDVAERLRQKSKEAARLLWSREEDIL